MTIRVHQTRGRRRAFTLIEMIATIVIMGTMGSIASGVIYQASRTYTEAALSAQLHAELSAGLDRIDRALREITLKSPYASSAPNITSLSASSITFNGTSVLAVSGGQATLSESGGPTGVLLQSVSAFAIQAFDESNAAMAATLSGTACDAVRRLSVSITLTRDGVSQTLRTKVFLRSLLKGGAP
ncbi:MAG: type II secretion system protein J [Phycisphaerales bacterium]